MIPDTLRGEYYKGAPTLIDDVLDEAYTGQRGPGAKPTVSDTGDVCAIVSPAYDYDYAASCAAWSYKALAESGLPDTFIILTQADRPGTTQDTFTTPYGYVRVDQTFAKEVSRRTDIVEDDDLFASDELVQSQLPLLQHAYKSDRERIKILPIAVSSDMQLKSFALDLEEIAVDLNRSYKVIAPTNLTEYGRRYSFMPFTQDRLDKVEDLDRATLTCITDNDPMGLLEHVDATHLSMNNYLGVVLSLLMMSPEDVRVNQYYTTHAIDGNTQRIVSFASISQHV